MQWLEPWTELGALDWPEGKKASHAARLVSELKRTIGPHHALRGISVRLLAFRFDDMDDTLFELEDGRVAEVHVTHRGGEEPDPRWPATNVFSDLGAWAKERMVPQHEEWKLVNE